MSDRDNTLSIEALHMCQKAKLVHKCAAPCRYDLRILAEDNPVVGAETDKFGATDHS